MVTQEPRVSKLSFSSLVLYLVASFYVNSTTVSCFVFTSYLRISWLLYHLTVSTSLSKRNSLSPKVDWLGLAWLGLAWLSNLN